MSAIDIVANLCILEGPGIEPEQSRWAYSKSGITYSTGFYFIFQVNCILDNEHAVGISWLQGVKMLFSWMNQLWIPEV